MQLALQFHPDKAKCPSAETAFKELAKAYQCLSDDEARRHYDTYGTEDDNAPQQQQYRQHYESHFMTPEVSYLIRRSRLSHLTPDSECTPFSFHVFIRSYLSLFLVSVSHGGLMRSTESIAPLRIHPSIVLQLRSEAATERMTQLVGTFSIFRQRRSLGFLQFFPLLVLLLITILSSLFNSPSVSLRDGGSANFRPLVSCCSLLRFRFLEPQNTQLAE